MASNTSINTAINEAINQRIEHLLGVRINDMNRQDKQRAERLKETSCVSMYHNHNSETYRAKLKLKLLAKQNK